MGALIGTGNFQDSAEPIAIKNFWLGFEEIPSDLKTIYTVKGSSKLQETYLELGDIGPMNEFKGAVDYEGVDQGYKMTIVAKELAKGIKIQRKFFSTDQLDIVEGLPRLLGLTGHRRLATDAVFPFNNAFNTSLLTIDGLQLCSSAHTSANQGSNQSNFGTSAFGAVSVEATRINMTRYSTNKDQRFMVKPDMLLVPQSLSSPAWELNTSQGKTDSANNDYNFQKGRWTVVVSDWLEDQNNWFMIDSKLMKMFCTWNNITKLEFGQTKDFDGMIAKYRAYMYYGFGCRDWRFVFGHQVS